MSKANVNRDTVRWHQHIMMQNPLGVSQAQIDRTWSKVCGPPSNSRWQKRTGWSATLKGISFRTMEQLKAQPDEPIQDESMPGDSEMNDSDSDEPNADNPVPVIWKAMLSMAQTSQYIVSKAELAIRTEAARIEPRLLPSPLDIDPRLSVEEQVRPWQEVVATIFRAERPDQHDIEDLTVYSHLNSRQYCYLHQLWELAAKRQDPDPFGEKQAARQAKLEFSPLESACLAFCLSLLNQRALHDVKECAMVNVLAVLGWGRDHWKAPDEYMVTPSHLIQTSRWMVVARSLELANDRNVFVRKWTEEC